MRHYSACLSSSVCIRNTVTYVHRGPADRVDFKYGVHYFSSLRPAFIRFQIRREKRNKNREELRPKSDSGVPEFVDFQTDPSRYRHWKLSFDGRVATLAMDIAEDGGIRPGCQLKLNSYDLGVDIELQDALQRIRFEHPEVASVVLTSRKPRIFCSGANIYMLGLSGHAWKVNFCKFTNETRNGIEDSSARSGLKFIAACNGSTAGGGYELALACDEIVLVDDRYSAVSLPEVALLGVLPGTGGLTRLTDKRHVRRDLADVFCTTPDGVRGQRAMEWSLVDAVVKPQEFDEYVSRRALELAEETDRPADAAGIALTPLERTIDARGYHYRWVDAELDPDRRSVTLTVRAPESTAAASIEEIQADGAAWWPLAGSRELDDAILSLRINQLDRGLWILKTAGDWNNVLAADDVLFANRDHWFVREVIGMMRRTLARIIEGWQLWSIFSWSSGAPLSLVTGNPLWGTGGLQTIVANDVFNTPDLVGVVDSLPKSFGEVRVGTDGDISYFTGLTRSPEPVTDYYGSNPDALQAHAALFQIVDGSGNAILRNPKPGTTGNLGPAWLQGPGSLGVDAALSKSVQIRENMDFTLRIDAINLLNTPLWNDPNVNINSVDFGRITGAGGARTFTLNARIDF